ncbi:MAG: hypothetical protein LKE40_05510 [Spirochaetia bacterium]|jgi:membrane protein YqaA with SNARE-associated domain|nr:hypothetical protein [Spirochaetia bacterium]
MTRKRDRNEDVQHQPLFREDGTVDWKKLILRSLVIFLVVLAIIVAYQQFIKGHQNFDVARKLYRKFGERGVMLFVFLVDAFIVPMTVDVIFPLIIAWSPLKVMLILGTASCAGGYFGYWIGRFLSHFPWVHRLIGKIEGKNRSFIYKNGAWGIVLAALTPIPYSTICWAAGMLCVARRRALLACTARYARMLIYFLLLKGGLHLFT